MSRVFALVATAAVSALLAYPACASTVMVQGLGLFSAMAPTTRYVAPNESFAFSFDLQSPVTPSTRQGSNLFATGISDFIYSLDGVVQQVTLSAVEFQTDGFDLVFDDQTKLDFVGADLGSDGTVDIPTWGSYAVFVLTPPPRVVPSIRTSFVSAAFAQATPQQIGTAMVVTSGPVPEPASWVLLIAGFGATGAALRRRRRQSAPA